MNIGSKLLLLFLVDGTLRGIKLMPLVKECLSKLKECGLQVAAITSDQGSNFACLANELGISADHPYITHGGEEIIVMPNLHI